jgi:hypothetical protein
MNDVAQKMDPARSFSLDLLYPGVWGAMIVLLFLRIANFGIMSLTNVSTLFGILIAAHYGIGFVNARVIAHYNLALTLLDSISSVLIFVCFYLLGFSQDRMPVSVDYFWFYIFLIAVTVSPILRRTVRTNQPFWTWRTVMALCSAGLVFLAFLNVVGTKYLSWLTPSWVLGLLCGIFAVYLLEVWHRGVA